MAGQQAMQQFLQNPFPVKPQPGKAPPTGILAPAFGAKPSPKQAQAQKQIDRANREAQFAARDQRGRNANARAQVRFNEHEAAVANRRTLGQAQADQAAVERGAGVVQGIGDTVFSAGNRLEQWAESVPTPGGIGILLALIFLFLWAIVPVNGKHTRAELLWLTLTGRTQMASAPDAGTDTGSTSIGTGSGGFGSGGFSNPILGSLPIRDWTMA